MRTQMSGQVNVEVDAAPQQDLNKVMEEIREHYETVAAKALKDAEGWFQAKVRQLSAIQQKPAAARFCSLLPLFLLSVGGPHQGGGSHRNDTEDINRGSKGSEKSASGSGD